MKTLALIEPKPSKTFRDKNLAVVMMVAALLYCSVISAQTDSLKYSQINGYGFKYKRMAFDSTLMVPLSTSPHVPYRRGGVRYNSTDSVLQVWTGAQWISFTPGLAIDTANAWMNLIRRRPGTDTVEYLKGGGWQFAFIDSAGAGITLTNVGTGYALVTTPNGSIKRLSPGYGVLMDSTTTANSITVEADTTGSNPLVTTSDLTDAVANVAGGINPGIYIAPAQSFDPSFVVVASGIPHPSNAFSHGATVAWEFLEHSTQHNSSFYDSVYANDGNGRLVVKFPEVKNVLNTTITVDETFASKGIFVGSSTSTNDFTAPAYRMVTIGVRLTGDGSGNWTKSGAFNIAAFYTVSTHSTSDGGTGFTLNTSLIGVDYDRIAITYLGPNNYTIKRVYSGLGGYTAKFILMDNFGNPVTSNPTTDDEIMITGGAMHPFQLTLATYDNNGDMSWLGPLTNFWILGAYECWLVASPVSTTSVLVRWQTTYPSATTYKIYRSTTKYGSRTLVHTGTEGSYTDTGLTTGTLYYYHMVAVIGGVDTYITYFKTNTR